MGLIHECTQEVQDYVKESFLFWFAEWNVEWQTQEYLRRSHAAWWNDAREAEPKPLSPEMLAELREFHDSCREGGA